MWTRRDVLRALTILVGSGCSSPPPPPPADQFLSDFVMMDRAGARLTDPWIVTLNDPLDVTIQYQTVGVPKKVNGRPVTPPDRWVFTSSLCDENDKVIASARMRDEGLFGEESIAEKLTWESPDKPKSLPQGVDWQWSYLRLPQLGTFTLILRLFPTAIQLGSSPQIDFGTGVELSRHSIVVLPGTKPEGALSLSIYSEDALNRKLWRSSRNRK